MQNWNKQLDIVSKFDEELRPLLANISKSHKRGFTNSTRTKHANTILETVNNFASSIRELPQGQETLCFNFWQNSLVDLRKAYFQLKVYITLPNYPELKNWNKPYQLFENNLVPADILIDPYLSTSKDLPTEYRLIRQEAIETSEEMPLTPLEVQIAVVKSVPEYSGSPQDLQQFVDAVQLIQTTIVEHPEVCTLAVKTRLKGSARQFIRQEDNSLALIVDRLKQNIKLPDSHTLVNRINALKPTNNPEYVSEIEKLTKILKSVYIAEGTNADAAEKNCAAVVNQAIINNTTSSETRTVLKANDFATTHEVIGKYSQCTSDDQQKKNLLARFTHRGKHGRGRSRGNGGYNNQWNGRGNNNYGNQWNNRGNNNYGNHWNERGNGRGNGRGRGRGRGYNNYGNNNQVNVMQENHNDPQAGWGSSNNQNYAQ